MGKPLIEEKIQEELNFVLDKFHQYGTTPFIPHSTIKTSISNIICSVVFGKRYEYNDPEFTEFARMLDENFELTAASGLISIFPILRRLPGDPFNFKKLPQNLNTMRTAVNKKIEQHRKGDVEDTTDSLIDAYIQKVADERDKSDSSFYDEQGVMVMLDLFAAGTETTATVLTWGLLYMIHHPDIQSKVRKEIHDVIGAYKVPSMKDKAAMPYTEATVMEILRVSDITALNLPHVVSEDVVFRGYKIPRGTTVMGILASVHRDENIWNDPEKFDPNNFLDEEGKIHNKEYLVPFSMGKRVCVGESLARMELFLFFAAMIQRFTFTNVPGTPLPDTEGNIGLTITPKPFKLIATPNN
jgi:cytochrome P450 family 2 subfamily U polypeptide 1